MSEVDCRENDWSELVESLKARIEELEEDIQVAIDLLKGADEVIGVRKRRTLKLEAVVEKAREFDRWFSKPCSHGGVMLDFLHEHDVEAEMLKMWEHVELALAKLEEVSDG